MKTQLISLLLLLTITHGIFAQTKEPEFITTRKKVQFSLAFGGGLSALNYKNSENNSDLNDVFTSRISFPNVKLGAMMTEKTALNFYVPMGFQNNESFTIYSLAVQHWSKNDEAWFMLGAGRLSNMNFDFSADRIGWGVTLSSGLVFLQNKYNAIDFQVRTMWGLAGSKYDKSLFAFDMLFGIDLSSVKQQKN